MLVSELSVHSALLIVNIPKITKTRLTIIHKGPTMFSLFDTCSALKTAIKAKNTKDATDNKPDSHLGKRLVWVQVYLSVKADHLEDAINLLD